MELKRTPLTEKHIALGAKMVDFAGYYMPVMYTSIKEEHAAVRNDVGVFDVSHMGEFILKGEGALDLVQKISSNDASILEIGDAQYTCMPNGNGGIVDDMIIYRLPEDLCAEGERAYMLVVNASNIDKDWAWIEENNSFEVRMKNISNRSGLLAVQGPKAKELVQRLTAVNLDEIEFYHFKKGTVAGIDNVLISATGYTGSGGFELYCDNNKIDDLWDALFNHGEDLGVKPVGLGARDTLRLEMGYCLYGNDIDDTTSPIEAGLKWITKLNKGPFNSSEIFQEQVDNGVDKRLVGFKVDDRRIPRKGYGIVDENGDLIGEVSSGTMSPSLEIPIGMGYVKKESSKKGTAIGIDTGKKILKAEIVRPPFYKG